ncbi:type II secretion protein F [Varibaculum vaginae]|uniref:type II secretion protein F n=1 Tax=Varibaculum vaginae TaxID=2364797 RepID=UPI000F085B75|nr:type II secretion protein F [Varibaculum vaginae]
MFYLAIWIFLGALPWFLPQRSCSESTINSKREPPIDPAIILDLANAGLAAGSSIPRVLSALATACREPRLSQVSSALIFGVNWKAAWSLLTQSNQSPEWARYLSQALEPAWKDGVAPEALLKGAGIRVRASKDQRARQAAQKLAVRLVVPLGICQLPAFIFLGIVPIILAGLEEL